jgi:hypothetical protein
MEEKRGLEEKAWAVIRQIDNLLSELIDLLKPYMDPIDEWELEREAVETIRDLASWVEAVARGDSNDNSQANKLTLS